MNLDHPQRAEPFRVSIMRVMAVTGFSVICSLTLTLAYVFLYPLPDGVAQQILLPTLFVATSVPILMTPPIALVFQNKRLRLTEAHFALQAAHQKLAEQARTDALTGLLNRGGFFAAVEAERLTEETSTMLMIDADNFKAVNDRFGHDQGDRALEMIAGAVRDIVRHNDLAARIGGEEFAIHICGRSPDPAHLMAERIRAAVANLSFEPRPGEKWPLSVSIGVASAGPADTLEDLLRRADRSMYRAKRDGRDRVVVSTAA